MAKPPSQRQTQERARSKRADLFAQRLEDEAVDLFEAAGEISSPKDLPSEALLRLMMSNAVSPGRNASQSVATLKALAEMKGWTGKDDGPEKIDLEDEVKRILDAQKETKGPRPLRDSG